VVSFTPREGAPGTHWIGGWMGSKAGLEGGGRKEVNILAPAGSRTSFLY